MRFSINRRERKGKAQRTQSINILYFTFAFFAITLRSLRLTQNFVAVSETVKSGLKFKSSPRRELMKPQCVKDICECIIIFSGH
jgi:hypothetical protein